MGQRFSAAALCGGTATHESLVEKTTSNPDDVVSAPQRTALAAPVATRPAALASSSSSASSSSTPSTSSTSTSSFDTSASSSLRVEGHGLGALLDVTREACDVLAPIVRDIYLSIDESTRKEKKDSSMFSIADGLVQHALTSWLFSGRIRDVVGEEVLTGAGAVEVDGVGGRYRVGDMEIPERLWQRLEATRRRFDELGRRIDAELVEPHAGAATTAEEARLIPVALVDSVFIDPIDGTREFCSGLGAQSTICVGFARAGYPVAGLVYRPIPDPPTWAIGCASESIAASHLPDANAVPVKGLLTSNGAISPFLAALMDELGLARVPSGGAGNKMLMLLENSASLYLQDRGVSRWDTCAAQAVLEAHHGHLAKLAPFVETGRLDSYHYVKADQNPDFQPGLATLSRFNRASSELSPGSPAEHPSHVLPYANLQGLLAVAASNSSPDAFAELRAAIDRLVAKGIRPAYD